LVSEKANGDEYLQRGGGLLLIVDKTALFLFLSLGVNNSQTHNFNTLVLQLLSQLKLIKDQDYKGYLEHVASTLNGRNTPKL
jgi:hypothetical protein